MKTILSLMWQLSSVIQDIALFVMLSGVFLAAWAIVQRLDDEDGSGPTLPRAVWVSDGTKTGLGLFALGLVLDMLSIAMRLSLPVT